MPLGLGLKKIESSPFIEKVPQKRKQPSPMPEFQIDEEPSTLEQTLRGGVHQLPSDLQRLQSNNNLQTAKTILEDLDVKRDEKYNLPLKSH
jgi:hypothetical protein